MLSALPPRILKSLLERETDELAFRLTNHTSMHFKIADPNGDGEQLAEIRMKLANVQRDLADIRIMMKDNFKQILLTLEALPNKVSEILAQHVAGLSVSHEPGLIPTSTTVASKPDSASSSPAHAPDVDATPDRTPAFLAPAAVASIPPIEVGDTHMPDATA